MDCYLAAVINYFQIINEADVNLLFYNSLFIKIQEKFSEEKQIFKNMESLFALEDKIDNLNIVDSSYRICEIDLFDAFWAKRYYKKKHIPHTLAVHYLNNFVEIFDSNFDAMGIKINVSDFNKITRKRIKIYYNKQDIDRKVLWKKMLSELSTKEYLRNLDEVISALSDKDKNKSSKIDDNDLIDVIDHNPLTYIINSRELFASFLMYLNKFPEFNFLNLLKFDIEYLLQTWIEIKYSFMKAYIKKASYLLEDDLNRAFELELQFCDKIINLSKYYYII